MKNRLLFWLRMLSLLAVSPFLASCASLEAEILYLSDSGEIESLKNSSASLGLDLEPRHYKEALRLFGALESDKLQRRALAIFLSEKLMSPEARQRFLAKLPGLKTREEITEISRLSLRYLK